MSNLEEQLEEIKTLEEWIKTAKLIEPTIEVGDDQEPFGMDECTNTWYTNLYKKDNKFYAVYFFNDSPRQKNEVTRRKVIEVHYVYEYVDVEE